eukprot:2352144-Prymnesium_polylepis.1
MHSPLLSPPSLLSLREAVTSPLELTSLAPVPPSAMAFSTILALVACLSGASAYAGAAVRAPVRAAAARMGVPVVDFEGAAAGDQDVALKVAKAGAYVVHRKVVTEQANMRLGT